MVSLSGKASRKVVENGIAALKAVWHRGAVDAMAKQAMGLAFTFKFPNTFFMTKSAARATSLI